MATPSEKTPEIESLLDSVAQKSFGRTRTESIKQDLCVMCGKEAKEFRDQLSQREFRISGMCQACQDSMFGK